MGPLLWVPLFRLLLGGAVSGSHPRVPLYILYTGWNFGNFLHCNFRHVFS